MSKGLEALERIKREAGIPYFSTLYDIDMWREDFKTVETALKDYEKKTKLAKEYKDVDNVAKRLIAIEIIKQCFDLNGFDELIPNSKWFENEGKRKFLKEVLL